MKKTKKNSYKKKKKTYKKKRTYKKKSYKKGGARLQYPKVYDNLEKSIKELTILNGIDPRKEKKIKFVEQLGPETMRPDIKRDFLKKLKSDNNKNVFMDLLHSLKKLNELNNLQKKKIEIFENTRKDLIAKIIKDRISKLRENVKESEFNESIIKIRKILNQNKI